MSSNHLSLRITGLVAVLAALVVARPQEHDVPRMELEEVLGRTICPLKVVVDEDPLRLPRRIKFMKCDREQAQLCPAAGAGGAGAGACCHRRSRHHGYLTQCVEVYDNVLVQFLPWAGTDVRNATHHVVQVPVGCACVVLTATLAAEDD